MADFGTVGSSDGEPNLYTKAPPLNEPRRMAFFGRYSDRGVR